MSADPQTESWRPGATLAVLHQRAALNGAIRAFFAARSVLEVETPALAKSGATDPHLASYHLAGSEPWLLQTSPEFAMKRLLAAGSGPIFQLCKCFRSAEVGRRHNPEFTLLEWYRPGFDYHQLMDEVQALVTSLLGSITFERVSYRQLWLQQLGVNPHCAEPEQLRAAAVEHLDVAGLPATMARSEWLDLLMSQVIEPRIAQRGAVFVVDFPDCQAALSTLVRNEQGESVAQRFELYLDGMEIANGYQELLDADELEQRFVRDNQRREVLGLAAVPIDRHLLAAQRCGMPSCAGVALGVDRLLMRKVGVDAIDQVLAFSAARV